MLLIRVAIAELTEAFGQVGAPDTCRAWTTKSGSTCANIKSPAAWKSYNSLSKVVIWVSPTVVAAEQKAGAPPAVLSVANSAGPGADALGALGPKLRLLVSPVKPSAWQVGAAVPP